MVRRARLLGVNKQKDNLKTNINGLYEALLRKMEE